MKKTFQMIVASAAILLAFSSWGQSNKLMGLVYQTGADGAVEPLPGANVVWMGTSSGAMTQNNGVFFIERHPTVSKLVVSYVGYIPDTVDVSGEGNVRVELRSVQQLQEVTVEGWRPSTGLDHSRTVNTTVMLEKELFKAACCNLSESFETNPSVDVAFTDALTGTRQIQMLGLAGPNTLISVENMPGVRGLASSQGIQFIPGTWINSIEVTKGIGPVVNGYESIAGQINVELKKPQESEKLYVNGYVNQSGRSEANVNYTAMAGKKWATTFLLHGSARPFAMDQNGDSFLDFPLGTQLNGINRWVFNSGTGWLGQFGIKVLSDKRQGGEVDYDPEQDKFQSDLYGFELNTARREAWGKLGYQFPDKPYKSVGLQLSATDHEHDSYYGLTVHEGRERSAYGNLIYQSIIGSTNHRFKVGASFLYDDFDERLVAGLEPMRFVEGDGESVATTATFDRTEVVPGAFAEYTYDIHSKFVVVAGIRIDQHNLFGTLITPRLHVRTNLSPTSTLRLSAGKGTRVANLLAENTGALASSRTLVFANRQTDEAYGYKPDIAWNYGLNYSQEFTLNYRPGSVTLDYFYTDFTNQAVLDYDYTAREARFTSLQGKSFSHSGQVQVDYEIVRRLDVRLAYRYLDVRTDYTEGLLTRPLIPAHRAFANIGYETKNGWKFDYTVQWLGEQRIPDTQANPQFLRLPSFAPDYVLMNAQVTKDLKDKWSVYLGVENITNFQLDNPIVNPENPFGRYFDTSMVWGPIFGRMAYLGFRYRLK